MKLLKKLCDIHSPSGEEYIMKEYLIDYIKKNSHNWIQEPEILCKNDCHDNLILKFGNPKTAIFSHIDTTGFTVGYGKEIIPIGSPTVKKGIKLTGKDSKGNIECIVDIDDETEEYLYKFSREIERGTSLVFKPNFTETEEFIISPYLDNRVGVWSALKIAETLENGIIAFTTYEEHKGGGAQIVSKYLYEKCNIKQALILDATWITAGIKHNEGTVISLRDSAIPRRKYINKIIEIAKKHKLKYQFEVESAGGSDGTVIQKSPYPIDWCFIGPPEYNVHSDNEKIHKNDIEDTLNIYKILMKEL